MQPLQSISFIRAVPATPHGGALGRVLPEADPQARAEMQAEKWEEEFTAMGNWGFIPLCASGTPSRT